MTATATQPKLSSRHVLNLIGGEWCDASLAATEERHNPADTRELVAISPLSTKDDVERAISSAIAAAGRWARTPLAERCRTIQRALDVLLRRVSELTLFDVLESGKTYAECRSEVERTLATVTYQVDRAQVAAATEFGQAGEVALGVRWQPLGVAAVITPWNFPFSVVLRKIVPALVSGNAIVVKPSELTPVSAAEIGHAFREADLPPGVLNIVFGDGPVVGSALVEDSRVDAISFTGSTRVGLGIQAAAYRHAKIQLEMGGKNAMVVLPDADFDNAVSSAVTACYTASGQWCVATSRILLEESIRDRFIDAFLRKVADIRVGNGLSDGVTMGPVVSAAQYHKVEGYLQAAGVEGRLLAGGTTLREGEHAHGFFVAPTVVEIENTEATVWQHEIFGPVVAVTNFAGFDEAMRLVNNTTYGLAASIYTRTADLAERFCEEAAVGRVAVNLPTNAGDSSVPGTGWKSSGRGEPEGGIEGVRFYTKPKATFVKL